MLVDRKWTMILIGSSVLVYSIVVLGLILTTPDVGLRVLLVEDASDENGIQIHTTSHMHPNPDWEVIPQTGDRLLRLGDLETHSFLDFACQFIWLRNAQSKDANLYPGSSLLKAKNEGQLSTLVSYFDGKRWVEVEFYRPKTQTKHKTYLLVQSLPLGDVILSFLWFSLQLGFFLLSALLCWNRPFDRAARVLFGLGIVALGAFIAGNHWWVIAANLWLIVPCAVCGILLPAVLLHFFLVFPRPKHFLQRFRGLSLLGVYLLPGLAVAGTLGFVFIASHVHDPGDLSDRTDLFSLLSGLRYGIYIYFSLAGVYFLLTLAALKHSLDQTQHQKEKQQLGLIWHGAQVASLLVAVTFGLAFSHPVDFALGSGRPFLFLATVSFMGAFSAAVVRHQLMQLDQIISRNMLYYVASLGLTGIISLIIALSILVPQGFQLTLTMQQALTVAAVLTVSVILLLWLRDLFQQMIDRQFFRDHYRLDKALERIQHSVAKLSDPKAIAQLFLSSCRDVLGVDRGALYLRTGAEEPFQLMALAGAGDAPAYLPLDAPFLSTLKEQGSLQRIVPGSRSELSPDQSLLWELNVDLVHGLESAEGLAGLVLLGHKRHAIAFTSEDLTFLNALGQIANVAMYSAQVVDQNINRLNEELQLKLETIAQQQRQMSLLQAQLAHLSETPNHTVFPTENTFHREDCKGQSPAMIEVLNTARKVAVSESSVLLRGESGTGKEVLAQVLHNNSSRAKKPMIRVHCASLSPSLLESELFGHVKGAYTGAHQDRVGRFDAANGGTLFLDEIGDISLETQIKLLRVLQERCFEPVGSVRTVHVDVRLITATHQNLEQLIAQKTFREDLFYRLNVITLEIPPLRERREDILELSLHFLTRAAARMGKPLSQIDDSALEALEQYAWPGNIRELENAIERAVVMAEGSVLTKHDLPAEIFSIPTTTSPTPVESKILKPQPTEPPIPAKRNSVKKPERKLAEVERRELLAALEECNGNKTHAAELLGIPRSTLFSKLKRHGLA